MASDKQKALWEVEESFRKYVELGKHLNDLEHSIENDMVEEYQVEGIRELCNELSETADQVEERCL